MPEVVGVRFKPVGRVYYFDPAGQELEVGDRVVVETARGLELGTVAIGLREIEANNLMEPLKPVLHKAGADDEEQAQAFQAKGKETLSQGEEAVARLHLPMKLLAAEYNLDGSRLTFYFTAEGRVDFRELVKELAFRFKTKVELRQVGDRDEAKILGGFGRCGQPLCCARWLSEFVPVSIRMAKEQDLSLNPAKISGLCGRLLCCLAYEMEQYRQLRERLPKKGRWVSTPLGLAKVVGSNALKETVVVELESQATVELPLGQVSLAEEGH